MDHRLKRSFNLSREIIDKLNEIREITELTQAEIITEMINYKWNEVTNNK